MVSNYITHVVSCVNEITTRCGPVLLYGENIDTGSRISGLARGLKVNPAGRIVNVGDCELAHCGVGYGIMLDGGNAVLFMKQLDFLLLGLDQLVNTFNYGRAFRKPASLGSFTIFVIVCDQGLQGPQSSLNSAGDIASLAGIDVFCLNAMSDVKAVLDRQFVSGGTRVICVSQRLFGAPALDLAAAAASEDGALFQYRTGGDITIACTNFALRQGLALADKLMSSGIGADLFHMNYVPGASSKLLEASCARTGNLVILDDSKSWAKYADGVVVDLISRRPGLNVLPLVRRGCPDYGVAEEDFDVDAGRVLEFLNRVG